jgi:hypothetical protein
MRTPMLRLILLVLCVSLQTTHADDAPDCEIGRYNAVTLIAQDMTLPHEALPSGVPESYDWQAGPRIGYGADMPQEWRAFIAWGQVYTDAAGTHDAPNTRVQIRDIEAYVLDVASGRWQLLQFDRLVEGAAYVADFADNASVEADIRTEADGSISVTAGAGYNFHFWPSSGRIPLEPQRIGGIFTTVQARLILHDPTQVDDRAQARYLMSVGADYWRALDAEWRADWSANGDVAIGRFRYITNEWQAFNMTTVPLATLCANPPPLR